MFVEGGKPSYNNEIRNQVDKFIYAGKNSLIRKAVASQSKALGETVLMLTALPYLWLSGGDYFFKISGRYMLSEKFDRTKWNSNKITGKALCSYTQISTRLWGFPRNKIYRVLYALLRRIWKLNRPNAVYENYLFRGLGIDNINFINPIGLKGMDAVGAHNCDE